MVTKAFFQRYFTASYPVQGLSLVSYSIVLLKWTVAVSDWYYNTELLIIIKKKKNALRFLPCYLQSIERIFVNL